MANCERWIKNNENGSLPNVYITICLKQMCETCVVSAHTEEGLCSMKNGEETKTRI